MFENIAGVVMVGGRSRRMGRNKALLQYKGSPLVEHMQNLLRITGLQDVYLSGALDGYVCIEDERPFLGPAFAMQALINRMSHYSGFLFVPVDMPLLEPGLLHLLLHQKNGSYFENWPLPAYIKTGKYIADRPDIAVKTLLQEAGIKPLFMPEHYQKSMINANTPEDWRGLVEA